MRTLKLSDRERCYILAAFRQSPKGPQGPRGADIAELRKALRIFDALDLDALQAEVAVDSLPEPGEAKAYLLEEADFTYLDRVFRDASDWSRTPQVARDLLQLDESFTEANKKK